MLFAHCRGSRRSVLVPLAALAAASAFAFPAAADEPPLGINLIQNPGADLGPTSVNGQFSVVVPGWSVSGNCTVASYVNTAGLPSPTSPGSPDRGASFFIGGPTNSTATVGQFISLGLLSDLIDSDRAEFVLSAWLGGTANQDDSALCIAVFNDANGDSLSTVSLTGPTAVGRQHQTGMVERSRAGVIPIGSRSVNVVLLMSRVIGPFNDGCADDVSLVVTEGYCPSDWNQNTAVDSDDIVAFFGDWESGEGDFDRDDDTDSDDVFQFFLLWDSGC